MSESECESWLISEVPFRSSMRVLGPLVVRIRTIWNGIATRWYVLPILQQVNEAFGDICRRLSDTYDLIASVDHDQAGTARELAEARLRIVRLEERVNQLEERLVSSQPPDGPYRS